MMSIRTRCPLGSVARAVLVVPSFRAPPFFSPRKNHHHHLYYPFFPLSSPLVVSHLITPRRKPLRHLSTRPIRRRRSSTRVSFPVARTSDFFDRCFPTSPFFPKKKKSQQLLFRASQKVLARRKQRRRILTRGVLSSRFLSFFYSYFESVVLLSLSLSLSASERREEEKNFFLLARLSLARSFYLKKLSLLRLWSSHTQERSNQKAPQTTLFSLFFSLFCSLLSFFLFSAFFHFFLLLLRELTDF